MNLESSTVNDNILPPFFQKGLPYHKGGNVWVTTGEAMSELAKEEAAYHDGFDENAMDVHQLGAFRNVHYHRRIWKELKKVPRGSRVLEIGAGSGFDAKELKEECELVLSDVSPKTLERLSARLLDERIAYVVADGEHLPFQDSSFDAVYMVATWHHLASPQKGLVEFIRVLKLGGRLVAAVEPNKTYFALIKVFRPLLIRLTRMKEVEVSHADEEMIGFSYREIKKMMASAGIQECTIEPMWFLAGILHYALEFLYRALKLKKRIVLPRIVEKVVVGVDEFLFRIPGMKHLCWHWIVYGRKGS